MTVGRSRKTSATPWAGPPPRLESEIRPPAPLRTLVGRRDLAFGDPVAIALAPGVEPDSLLLAWAVLEADGYRVGLDRYLVGDAGVAAAGSREVLSLPREGSEGPTSLADLAVTVSPDGRTVLVGVSVGGTRTTPAVRRLAILRIDPGAVASDAIDPPVLLPREVSSSAPDLAGDDRAACGGALGEGWAANDMLFLVCPGRPSVFRRVILLPDSASAFPRPGDPEVAAAIADELAFTPASGADATRLAGNAVAIDRLRGRYYRWSPWTRTLWSIDLAEVAGGQPRIHSITLEAGPTGDGSGAPPDGDSAARPLLALDATADRLFLLAPDAAGCGARVTAVDGATLTLRDSWSTSVEPYATMTLSPDGSLLYLATPPRGVVGAPRPLVAVEVLDTDPLAERLFAGRLPPGAWDRTQPLVVR